MSAPLWTTHDLLTAIAGRPLGAVPDDITGISIDSRTIGRGEAFFAIRGERFDGHDFVAQAFARGAATAVVGQDHAGELVDAAASLILVPDVMEGLRRLGRAARSRSRAEVVAVTGSVGKTGTKDMLAVALGAEAAVHHSPASFNNHWGVPLTLARMPERARYAVFEIGMNHPGEIEPLARMVRPRVAIITTVEPVHLEAFDDVESIARAKAEIFSGVTAGGAAVINRDNSHFDLLAELSRAAGVARIVGFGQSADADIRLDRVVLKPGCSTVAVTVLGEPVAYKIGAPGRHLVQNSLAVLGAVSLIGGDIARAALSLARLELPKGRGRRYALSLSSGQALLIDESYNANPASMAAAIQLLASAEPGMVGRRIAVLGDMLELGRQAPQMHAALAESLAAAGVDLVFAAGPLMSTLWEALPRHLKGSYADSATELEGPLRDALAPGDVVMVKGSNGIRLGPLVDSLRLQHRPAPQADAPQEETA